MSWLYLVLLVIQLMSMWGHEAGYLSVEAGRAITQGTVLVALFAAGCWAGQAWKP